jgi:hypothetical protein
MPSRSGSLGDEGGGENFTRDRGASMDAVAWVDMGAYAENAGRRLCASWAAARSRPSLERGTAVLARHLAGCVHSVTAQQLLRLGLDAVDEERAHFAECAKLGGVAEPAAGVGFWRGSGIGYAFIRDVGEAGVAE